MLRKKNLYSGGVYYCDACKLECEDLLRCPECNGEFCLHCIGDGHGTCLQRDELLKELTENDEES